MLFTNKTTSKRYEIKKSIFISHLAPIQEFKTLLKNLKEKHQKASHIIYAYRTLNEHYQIIENSSDNGEPKGCAGAPTLAVLRGEEIIESAIITVRYFGGIKLGTGGMIRGYGSAAKEVIKSSQLISYKKRVPIIFETSYHLVNRYEHYFKNMKIAFTDREFKNENVIWRVQLTDDEILKLEEFKQNL